MKGLVKIILLFAIPIILSACIFDDEEEGEKWNVAKVCPETGSNSYGMPNRGTFTDERDGNVYHYTTIGDQVWMAENLRFELPHPYSMCYGMEYCYPKKRSLTDTATTCFKDTTKLTDIAQRMQLVCIDNDCIVEEYCKKFGRYYALKEGVPNTDYALLNRDVVDTVCPKGWHLPTKAEWMILGKNVEYEYFRLTSDDSLLADRYIRAESNECGFSALLGGYINENGSLNRMFLTVGYYWTSTARNESSVETMLFIANGDPTPFGPDAGFNTIRCIMDSPMSTQRSDTP